MVPHPVWDRGRPWDQASPIAAPTLADTSGIRREARLLEVLPHHPSQVGVAWTGHPQEQTCPRLGDGGDRHPNRVPEATAQDPHVVVASIRGWDTGEHVHRCILDGEGLPAPDRGRRGAAARRPRPRQPALRAAVRRSTQDGGRQAVRPQLAASIVCNPAATSLAYPPAGVAGRATQLGQLVVPPFRPCDRQPGHMPAVPPREGSHLGRWTVPARPASPPTGREPIPATSSASGCAAIWPATRPTAIARDRFIRGPGSRLLDFEMLAPSGPGIASERPVEQRRQQLFFRRHPIPPTAGLAS